MANKFTNFISRLLLISCFLFTGYQSFAQYTATTLSTGGAYTAMAKDQSNNIYVVRYNGTNYEVAKYAGGNPASTTVIYTGLSSDGGSAIYPWGLAVNSHGDVFVTNPYVPDGWDIIKLTAPSYASTVIQRGNFYSALAVDASDNLLSMEYNAAGAGAGTYRLVRYPAGAESSAGTTVYDGFSYPSSSSYPWGIVTDSHSNIYLLDFLENSGGRLVKLTSPGYAPTALSTNKSFTSLAIDAGDNIYTTEKIDANTAKVVKYTDPAETGTTLYSSLTIATPFYPWGLAVNSSGQIFVNDGAASGNGRMLRLDPPSSLVSSVVRVGSSPTNVTSVSYTVTFNRSVAGVTTAAFSLTTTGITSASITSVSGSGTTYTVVVNTGSGDGTIRLNVTGTGITPAATNVPYTTGEVYTIDKTSPTGSLSINGGATITNNTTVTLTTSATDASTVQMKFSNDGTSWSANEALAATKSWALSAGDGLKTVYVQYTDAAGNAVIYSKTITLDQTAPETTITAGPANPTNSQTATFSLSSNEAGASFQYSYDGGPFTPTTSSLNISSIPAGTHTVRVRAIDPAGNIDATPDAYTWTVDLTSPVISSVSVPANGYYKAGDVLTFTVNYAENVVVTGTPYLDVILNSGNVKANYVGGSGTNALTFGYTVVNGDMDLDGIALGTDVQLNGGTINDPAGNTGLTTLHGIAATSGIFVSTTQPTVTLTSTEPAVLNHAITCQVTFSEAVTGFTATDISVTNGTVTALSTSDNITYNITVTPTTDGTVTIGVPAAVAQSVAGNNNQASNTRSFTYDITKPTVTSVAVPADGFYKAGDQLNFTATFSEPVVLDTTSSKPFISVTIGATNVNAVLSSATTTTLTFTYTVVAGDEDLDGITVGSLSLNGSTIKDVAGNNATLTLNGVGSTANVKVNTDIPSVTLSAPSIANGPYTATITFNEAVTGFTIGDVIVGNGVASNLVTTNNITFTVTITPSAEGMVTLNVGANAATNIGGNGNAAATQVSTNYDVTQPTVTSVTVPANGYYKAGDQLNFTVKFSEPVFVTGTPYLTVTIGSSIVNATLSGSTDSSLTFSYTVVDGDQDMDGITLGTLNGTIKDAAGNNATLTLHNIGATTGVLVNTTHATTVISTTAATLINTPYTANITFSEAVTGFVQSDITVTNATLSNLQTSDNITYSVLVTPVADGNITLSVPANVAVNIGNNGNTISNTLTNTYDGTAPTVTSVDVPANGYYKDGNTLNFTVHFSESILIDSSIAKPYINIVIGSTTVKALYHNMPSTDAVSFSYTVLPGQTDLDGITVGTLSGSITDPAGNAAVLTLNNVSSTANVFVQTSTPSVVLSTTAAERINAMFTVKAVFSEAVTGLTAGDFTVTNGTAANLQTTDNITYTIDVTPAADGDVSIYLPADMAVNAVNNGNTISNTLETVYDITAPLITAGQAFTTSEKSPVGTLVGNVTAVETAGTLQNWTITSDGSGGAFSIDNTGAIHVQNTAILESKANSTVSVTITVSDGLNTSIAQSVAITIKFVNQAPVLDPINNIVLCMDTEPHTVQLTGASAVETDQTYTFSASADKPDFDLLSVNAAGLLTYQLKANTSGSIKVTVTIKDDGGTDNGGVDTSMHTFTITVNSLPVAGITSDKGTAISKGDVVQLTATGGSTYLWDTGETTDIIEARPTEDTTYKVTVTNAEGCKDTAEITIKVVEDFKIDATNILTPNGDGKNDKWEIHNLESYPNNEVMIYDRAGRMVYNRKNYSNDWDGTVNGRPLAEGTYYYIIKIDGGKTAKGFITIVRDRY
jgi:large repetitive protein